jgi:hypothetical protein
MDQSVIQWISRLEIDQRAILARGLQAIFALGKLIAAGTRPFGAESGPCEYNAVSGSSSSEV